MAKMFYTLDETKAALGQSEDQIKALTREGRLREFRDGPRLMFKADQVDALKSQISGGDPLSAGRGERRPRSDWPTPAGGPAIPLTLADSIWQRASAPAAGWPVISGSGRAWAVAWAAASTGASPGSGMMNLKDDTALAADLGLSGTGLAGSVDSMGGMPSADPLQRGQPGREHRRAGSAGGSLGGTMRPGPASGTSAGAWPARRRAGRGRASTSSARRATFAADPMAQTAAPAASVGPT